MRDSQDIAIPFETRELISENRDWGLGARD